jgi:hypothetical protein
LLLYGKSLITMRNFKEFNLGDEARNGRGDRKRNGSSREGPKGKGTQK